MTDLDLYSKTQIDAKFEDVNASIAEKQDELESGVNIKTINGASILGEGNLIITGSGKVVTDFTSLTDAIAYMKENLPTAGDVLFVYIKNATTIHKGVIIVDSATYSPSQTVGAITIPETLSVVSKSLFSYATYDSSSQEVVEKTINLNGYNIVPNNVSGTYADYSYMDNEVIEIYGNTPDITNPTDVSIKLIHMG